MKVEFSKRTGAPERLVSEAELHFDDDGPLAGLKLVGFSVWLSAEGQHYVTMPCRPFGAGAERRYFDLLRGVDDSGASVKRLKAWILEQFEARGPREA